MALTPYMVIKGVVLRETETKEADKILTLLTAERGKLSVIARGARRKSAGMPPVLNLWPIRSGRSIIREDGIMPMRGRPSRSLTA